MTYSNGSDQENRTGQIVRITSQGIGVKYNFPGYYAHNEQTIEDDRREKTECQPANDSHTDPTLTVIVGKEIVFDGTSDRCENNYFPNSSGRAFRTTRDGYK